MSSLSTSAKAIGRVKKKNQGKKLMLVHSAERWEFSEFCVTRYIIIFFIFFHRLFLTCAADFVEKERLLIV